MSEQGFVRSLRAQWLGDQLRGLRSAHGLTLAEVATHLDRDPSVLDQYEQAEWPITSHEVVALLNLYGIHDSRDREPLQRVADRIWHLHHWDDGRGQRAITWVNPVTAGDAWFITPEWLTGRANLVRVYHPNLIPEPLQQLTYAGTLKIRSLWPMSGPEPMRAEALVEQAVLRQELEPPGLRREQLLLLAKLCQKPHITVRVLADDVRRLPVLAEPVTVFVMPEPYPAVAMIDGLAGRRYLEGPLAQGCTDVYQRLWELALPEPESLDVITNLAGKGNRP